jgi:TPR repeat protein
MKRTLLFALALIASGCADAGRSAFCEGLRDVLMQDGRPSVEDVHTCAEQGDPLALYWLGYMYTYGEGVARDKTEAVRWYRLSAEQGHQGAMHNLGRAYASGEGVPEDHVLAYMWYNLAAAQAQLVGFYQDIKDRLEERMTLEQIAEAQRLSREWLEAHPPGGN